MKSNLYVVSCDWFAIQCTSEWWRDEVVRPRVEIEDMPASNSANTPRTECETIDLKILSEQWRERDQIGITYQYAAEVFKVVKSDEFHPAYNCNVLLTWHGRPLLHLSYKPKRADVQPSSCQAKVANSALYSSQWPTLVRSALRAIGWQFVRVVRVDVAADFEYFANGRLPLRFVQDYLSKPTATRPTFIRKSSNKFRAFGQKAFDKLLFETLSWGTRESAVQVNLYNKTVELMRTDKPYIRKKWEDYGLPSDLNPPVKRYVWRVEFSINPSRIFMKSRMGTQVRELLSSDVETQANLEQLFASLLPDYFQFHELSAAARRVNRKVKDLPIVTLFDTSCAGEFKVRGYVHARKVGRTEKILMHRLAAIIDEQQCNADELAGLRAAYSKLCEIFYMKDAQGRGEITADDLLANFLCQLSPARVPSLWRSQAQKHRELQRYVQMLLAARDSSFQSFAKCYGDVADGLSLLCDKMLEMCDGLPEWFFDATDVIDDSDESYWESIAKSIPSVNNKCQ